ncbi:MAG: acetyltransferase [Rhodobacteraceae bacterium]|nr:acetyltransferase [Paracoccaceae bacterium]
MNGSSGIVLFGAKSPFIVEHEETLARLKTPIAAIVSLGGPSRAISRDKLVDMSAVTSTHLDYPFLPCAFATGNRMELVRKAFSLGFALSDALIDPFAAVASSSKVGPGSYINAGAVIGGVSILGQCCVVNRNASIGHHCLISEFVNVGPGAILASNVVVGKGASIGAGATVLPGVRIGENAVVAGGSVVRKDVAENSLVTGNPARPSRLRPSQTAFSENDQE